MPYTLLMRLTGPMQAWGVSSRFGIRETMTEPSKSGVLGLLCAALGWDRAAPTHLIAGKPRTLADLAALRFGIRVVQEGIIRRDYHTAQNVLRAKAKLRPGKPVSESDLQTTVLSERYFLADAYFLVGLESEDKDLLIALDEALSQPYWPLSLGRKAFPASCPVRYTTIDDTGESVPGIVDLSLLDTLMTADDPFWRLSRKRRNGRYTRNLSETAPVEPMPICRLVMDMPAVATSEMTASYRLVQIRQVQRADVPLSFDPRRYAPRDVLIYTVEDDLSI